MDSLSHQLDNYCQNKMHSFHTPGHKGREDLLSSLVFPDYDLTELPELDMLHNPQGIIAKAQKRAAAVYGAKQTFFLVNGATSGNQAMFLSLMPSLSGKNIIIQRTAHRSVMGGLVLSDLTPEYIAPIIHPEFELPLGIDENDFSINMTRSGAVHITSPSYYGSVFDLESIIKFRDEKAPDSLILVDQAHGAHYKGELFPPNAVAQGADLVVHSTHKTLRALTQAAMLHVQGERIDSSLLRKSLEILLTSSPNYMLMASLENALKDLENPALWEDLHTEVMTMQNMLEGPLRFLNHRDEGSYGIKRVDWSKILVNLSSLEISAPKAVEILRKGYQIEPELWDKHNILFLLGVGNRPQEIRVLSEALKYLVKRYYGSDKGFLGQSKDKNRGGREILGCSRKMDLPPLRFKPREAFLARKRFLKVKECLGQIAGETISIYPPGIPLITAGEEITLQVRELLLRPEDYYWQGWERLEYQEIQVIDV